MHFKQITLEERLSAASVALRLLAEDTQDPAGDAGQAADRPLAYAETTATGAKLIVGRVCVRWWKGTGHGTEAADMAEQINTDLASWMAGRPQDGCGHRSCPGR